jgi:hypothetical protein
MRLKPITQKRSYLSAAVVLMFHNLVTHDLVTDRT